jgi:uncharacterized protein
MPNFAKRREIELRTRTLCLIPWTSAWPDAQPIRQRMPLLIQLDALNRGAVSLNGKLTLSELDMVSLDDLVEPAGPLAYALMAEKNGDSILLEGSLEMQLKCECARCLQPFDHRVTLRNWSCLLPLKGEDSVQINKDTADLTPYLREDTFLAFPQHPLCGSECGGIAKMAEKGENPTHSEPPPDKPKDENVWAELDKLNLK